MIYINSHNPLEIELIILYINGTFAGVLVAPQRLNTKNLSSKHPNIIFFYYWLVGFTDADGGFTIEKSGNKKYSWVYHLDQRKYNERILYYIKNILGVGSITYSSNMAKFRIRDRKNLRDIVLPIFNQYPLLTSKMYRYNLWLEGFNIWGSDLPLEIKINKIEEIRNHMSYIPSNYLSPIWLNKDLTSLEQIK